MLHDPSFNVIAPTTLHQTHAMLDAAKALAGKHSLDELHDERARAQSLNKYLSTSFYAFLFVFAFGTVWMAISLINGNDTSQGPGYGWPLVVSLLTAICGGYMTTFAANIKPTDIRAYDVAIRIKAGKLTPII